MWCTCFCIRLCIHRELALECVDPDLIHLPVPHIHAWHSPAWVACAAGKCTAQHGAPGGKDRAGADRRCGSAGRCGVARCRQRCSQVVLCLLCSHVTSLCTMVLAEVSSKFEGNTSFCKSTEPTGLCIFDCERHTAVKLAAVTATPADPNGSWRCVCAQCCAASVAQ